MQVFRTTPGCLRKPQWNLIDPSALSPWNVMSWGMKQLKGAVGFGLDTHALQAQELVLVGNLMVRWVLSLHTPECSGGLIR